MRPLRPFLASVLALAAASACTITHAACWDRAAQETGVPVEVLYGVARTESSLNPAAYNRAHVSRTSSYDIGLMQINSRHLPWLAKHGIDEEKLRDGCVNLLVGARLLADLFQRKGATWDAIGANNAACTQLRGDDCIRARATYAWKVYNNASKLFAHGPSARRDAPSAQAAAGIRSIAARSLPAKPAAAQAAAEPKDAVKTEVPSEPALTIITAVRVSS